MLRLVLLGSAFVDLFLKRLHRHVQKKTLAGRVPRETAWAILKADSCMLGMLHEGYRREADLHICGDFFADVPLDLHSYIVPKLKSKAILAI